jgi:hypothetical protein
LATARCTDWRIHQVAYVENLNPRRQSNFSTARLRPSVLRDRDDEAQVGLDHATLGGGVAALERLGERDLLGRGQQLVAADVGEEELQAVGRSDDRVRVRRNRGRLLGALRFRLSDVEADCLELARQLLDLVVGEVVFQSEGLELRLLDEAALLGGLDDRPATLALE